MEIQIYKRVTCCPLSDIKTRRSVVFGRLVLLSVLLFIVLVPCLVSAQSAQTITNFGLNKDHTSTIIAAIEAYNAQRVAENLPSLPLAPPALEKSKTTATVDTNFQLLATQHLLAVLTTIVDNGDLSVRDLDLNSIQGDLSLLMANKPSVGQELATVIIEPYSAILLEKIGIKVPIAAVGDYGPLNRRFLHTLRSGADGITVPLKRKIIQRGIIRRERRFEKLRLASQLSVLDRYKRGVEVSTFDVNNPERELITRLIDLQAGLENYENYLRGHKLDRTQTLELALDAKGLDISFPDVITPEQMQAIADLENYVIERAKQELATNRQELATNRQVTAKKRQELATNRQELARKRQELASLEELLVKFKILANIPD